MSTPDRTVDPRTPAGVAHIARLSRLALTPIEAQAMADHLARMLDAVSALERLDTTGVSAALHDGARAVLRPDVVAPSLPADQALQNAPARGPAGFEVPAVLAE